MRKLHEVAETMAAYSVNDVVIEGVTDLEEMARSQITHLPSIAVDGQVVCAGRVPTCDELRAWVNPPECVA